MIPVEKIYIKKGKRTSMVHQDIINCLDQFAENIGNDILKNINPDSDLGKKLAGNQKVSFKVKSKEGGRGWNENGHINLLLASCFATAHLNGSDEILFPFSIKVEVKPFDFYRLIQRQLENHKNDFQKRFNALPKNSKKNASENENLKKAIGLLIDGLKNLDDEAVSFIEKNLSALEKSK